MAKKKVDIIGVDNKPMSDDIQSEPLKIDKRFVKTELKAPKKKKVILTKNNRVYIELDKYHGMYADTGEVFKL